MKSGSQQCLPIIEIDISIAKFYYITLFIKEVNTPQTKNVEFCNRHADGIDIEATLYINNLFILKRLE
jgi:hypothetical protein